MNRTSILLANTTSAAVVLTALLASAALAAGTPEDKCEAGKNLSAGKYAGCLGKALNVFIATGDASKYAAMLGKCESKMVGTWGKLEGAAVAAGTTCPSTGDQTAIGDFLDACNQSVAVALDGGPLGPDPVSCASDLASCDSSLSTCSGDLSNCNSDLGTATTDLATCEGDLNDCLTSTSRILKTGQTTCYNDAGSPIACAGSKRDGEIQAGDAFNYTDNGNGTITDNVTGLMWEKLSDDGSIHDKDNQYAGLTAAIAKATSLNTANFAGHNDWRIPNLRELESLPDYSLYNLAVRAPFRTNCVANCTVLTCSCTKANIYFTSTVYTGYPAAVWKINMIDGDVYAGDAVDTHYARAVRTAH